MRNDYLKIYGRDFHTWTGTVGRPWARQSGIRVPPPPSYSSYKRHSGSCGRGHANVRQKNRRATGSDGKPKRSIRTRRRGMRPFIYLEVGWFD